MHFYGTLLYVELSTPQRTKRWATDQWQRKPGQMQKTKFDAGWEIMNLISNST
jgi:hypothetical protein